MELQLPGGAITRADLRRISAPPLEVFHDEEPLSGYSGRAWADSIAGLLASAFKEYETGRSRLGIENCRSHATHTDQSSDSNTFPRTRLILLDSDQLSLEGHETDRAGYHHPKNPGPLIQSRLWQDGSIRYLIVHEAVHRWCLSASASSAPTETRRWKEEAFADWVAYRATGIPPRWAIQRYLKSPQAASLYGGGFLWALAKAAYPQVSRESRFQRELAALHLGLRPHLIDGKLDHRKTNTEDSSQAASSSPGPYPYGTIAPQCPTGSDSGHGGFCLPYWSTPWGETEIGSARYARGEPTGFFVWKDMK